MGSTTIWIVDDSKTVRKLMETILMREGYTTRSFADGVEVMNAVVNEQDLSIPSIIFLDIIMPKMGGYEVARKLKKDEKYARRFASTTIVMLTRLDGIFDHLKARLAGAKGYMTKPFKRVDILAMVKHCLSQDEQSDPLNR